MNNDQDIHRTLRSFRYWIGELRWYLDARVASELSELDQRNLEAFPYERDDVVSRIDKFGMEAANRSLDPSRRAELRGIADELADLRPVVAGLRLRFPDVEALARAAQEPAPQPT